METREIRWTKTGEVRSPKRGEWYTYHGAKRPSFCAAYVPQGRYEILRMESDLPDCLTEAMFTIDERKQFILDHVEAAVVAHRCAAAFPDMAISVTFGMDALSLKGVLIQAHVKRIRDIAPILGWLALEGYKLKGKPNDYAEAQRRTWFLGKIALSAFFDSGDQKTDGPACRFVKVGEKLEPVYRLMCDGDGDADAAPAEAAREEVGS